MAHEISGRVVVTDGERCDNLLIGVINMWGSPVSLTCPHVSDTSEPHNKN
jgi:hypothetical protein